MENTRAFRATGSSVAQSLCEGTAIDELRLAFPFAKTEGHEIDLAALVETYARLLFRVAHSVLHNRAEAEDVVQDVFVRAVERRSALADVRDMRVWLIRIAWNAALDRRRRVRPDQMDELFANSLIAPSRPADVVLGEEQRVATILREIDRLPKGERQVLLLSALDELGTSELAKIVGRSESGTRALLFRARSRLRDRLKGAL